MATDLNVLANEALRMYRENVSARLFELTGNADDDLRVLETITELTEEYQEYSATLVQAQDKEDANDGAFTAFVDAFGMDVDGATELEDTVQAFDQAYAGTMSMEEYAQQYIDEVYSVPAGLEGYIDYEKFARDLTLGGDMTENDGHIFHSNW